MTFRIEFFNRVEVIASQLNGGARVEIGKGIAILGTGTGTGGNTGDNTGDNTGGNTDNTGFLTPAIAQQVCALVEATDSLTVRDDLQAYVTAQFTGDDFISLPTLQTPCDPATLTSANCEILLNETQTRIENIAITSDLSQFIIDNFANPA